MVAFKEQDGIQRIAKASNDDEGLTVRFLRLVASRRSSSTITDVISMLHLRPPFRWLGLMSSRAQLSLLVRTRLGAAGGCGGRLVLEAATI
jgi:hypothetical protein